MQQCDTINRRSGAGLNLKKKQIVKKKERRKKILLLAKTI